MANCPDRQETLWLDVHGELNPAEAPAWREHLAHCPGCREERERLARTLRLTREAMPVPELKPERARILRRSILQRLAEERSEPWWRRHLRGVFPRPAFALAAAGLAIMAVGFLITWEDRTPRPAHTVARTEAVRPGDQAPGETEILANLGILEEMDVIQKVVKVVDHKDVVL